MKRRSSAIVLLVIVGISASLLPDCAAKSKAGSGSPSSSAPGAKAATDSASGLSVTFVSSVGPTTTVGGWVGNPQGDPVYVSTMRIRNSSDTTIAYVMDESLPYVADASGAKLATVGGGSGPIVGRPPKPGTTPLDRRATLAPGAWLDAYATTGVPVTGKGCTIVWNLSTSVTASVAIP